MKYADIADHDEDTRIDIIGRTVMGQKKTVAFVTDGEPGKAQRYIDKLQSRFPGIRVLEQWNGPVPDTVTVKVGPTEETEQS